MGKLKQIMLLVMVGSLLVFTSCSKSDDDGGSGGSAASGTVKATIGGKSFTSLKIATTATKTTAGGVEWLRIQGNDSDGNAIVLTINPYDGVGTYNVSDASVFTTAFYTKIDVDLNNPQNSKTENWVAPYDSSGVIGEIKISEETDTTVKGTFSFTGKSDVDGSLKEITNGSFNVEKQIL